MLVPLMIDFRAVNAAALLRNQPGIRAECGAIQPQDVKRTRDDASKRKLADSYGPRILATG